MDSIIDIETLLNNISLLSVYKNFLSDDIALKFVMFLEALNSGEDFNKTVELYTDFTSALYSSEFKGDFSSYVRDFVLTDKNIVSSESAKGKGDEIPLFIMGAFEYELRILSDIAGINFEDIRELFYFSFEDKTDAINSIPPFDSYKLLFTKDQIQNAYKTQGYGIFSKYNAFKFDNNLDISPIVTPDKITFADLILYDYQKETLRKNTIAFLKGKQANNVLLYGDRGCGKSSSIKALLNEFSKSGLKIIQIQKENISHIEDLMVYLAGFPSKFIIYIDDLVFDENDPLYANAKAALEGTLVNNPDNILIYATTNRRHLIKETFKSRMGDEVHLNDTLDEAASLSDRFGLTITFISPDKKEYLEIVKTLADNMNIEYNEADLFKEAESFALLKGTRAPRIARQFLSYYVMKSA